MELIIKTKSHPKAERYQDGDIIETYTDLKILNTHAQIICHPRKFPMNTFGLRDRNTLLEKYTAAVSKFKFTRLNSNDVQKLNLITGEEYIINTIPNDKKEAMDVYQFISRRVKSPRHRIFGTSQGNEVWYTGNRKITHDVCDACWNDIETHTDNLKTNHEHFPFSETDKRHFLPLNCCGFNNNEHCEISDETCCERQSGVLKEQVFEEDPVLEDGEPNNEIIIVAKRKWQVPYWDLISELGINVDDVRNRNKELDARVDGPLENRSKMDDINIDKVAEGIVTI